MWDGWINAAAAMQNTVVSLLFISDELFYFYFYFFVAKQIFYSIKSKKSKTIVRYWKIWCTHLSLYSSLCAYDCTLFSSIKNLTRWKKEAVTDGGCLRSSTSTGSFDERHMMCSVQTGVKQHSLSEQSIMPSDMRRTKKFEYFAQADARIFLFYFTFVIIDSIVALHL